MTTALTLAAMLTSLSVAQDARVLFDFETAEPMQRVAPSGGVEVQRIEGPEPYGVCLEVTYPGEAEWPHVVFDLPAAMDWSGYDWFAVDVYNEESVPRTITAEIRGEAGPMYKPARTIQPRTWTTVRLPITRMAEGSDPMGWCGEAIDVTRVTGLSLVYHPPLTQGALLFDNLRLERAVPLSAPELTAQSVRGGVLLEWTAVEGAEEYRIYRAEGNAVEASDATRLAAVYGARLVDIHAEPGGAYAYAIRAYQADRGEGELSPPVSLTCEPSDLVGLTAPDRYGGSQTAELKATGFFRTEKVGDQWWLVTPEGHPYFGLGVCAVTVGDTFTRVTGREDQFERWLPSRDEPAFADAWRPWWGFGPYGLDDSGLVLSPYVHGVIERHGANWQARLSELAAERLPDWGLNLYGAWCHEAAIAASPLPYVSFYAPECRQLGNMHIPDVYDPRFEESLAEAPEKLARYRDDPRLLGMYSDNEILWIADWERGMTLVDLIQEAADDQPARVRWLAWLRERHGDIADLNAAWGSGFQSWDALSASHERLPRGAEADADRDAFLAEYADRYFRLTTEAIRGALPNHLTLGERVVGVCPPQVMDAIVRHCDVITYNVYRDSPMPGGGYETFEQLPDKPFMIGEFAARGADSGLPNTKGAGSVVPTQADRGWYYQRYLAAAMRSGRFVGVTWFQYIDEPATGRFGGDVEGGENSNYGWVNVNDEPYEDFIRFARLVNRNVYLLREP